MGQIFGKVQFRKERVEVIPMVPSDKWLQVPHLRFRVLFLLSLLF